MKPAMRPLGWFVHGFQFDPILHVAGRGGQKLVSLRNLTENKQLPIQSPL